jgi:hypothetical protein
VNECSSFLAECPLEGNTTCSACLMTNCSNLLVACDNG